MSLLREVEQSSEVATAAIDFKDVSKSFGKTTVLDRLDLSVEPGEKVTLIGASGSGKTTVLRLAMLLETPDSGEIHLFGSNVHHQPDGSPRSPRSTTSLQRRCGMVFQQFNLFPHMTILENITLAPKSVLKLPKTECEELAFEHLKLVGLAEKSKSYPGQLSGGQQQRIAIARALALRPEILLLDEITSSLDPELVSEVLEVVKQIAFETKITFLVVTHEMRFARQISDRVAMFDTGRVIEQGSAEKIFTQPDHERTRTFLNSVLNH